MHQSHFCSSLNGTDLLHVLTLWLQVLTKWSQHHLLYLVQVVGPPVINIMEEACSDHGHYLQVSVVPLQHSRLSTQTTNNRQFSHNFPPCLQLSGVETSGTL